MSLRWSTKFSKDFCRIITPSKHISTCYEKETTKAVNEAEKVVGYPTSFLSLRWLLNDEVANIAAHVKKLIGTNHPLIFTARNLLMNKQNPTWGLIVLLISKAGGLKEECSTVDCDITAGILHSQRVLAEITEMIRTSNRLHNSVFNKTADTPEEETKDINFGNKLSLLAGDYLLSTSFKELAVLKNNEVNEIIATSLRDLVEAEFLEPRDEQNRSLPAPPLGTNSKNMEIPNEFGIAPFKTKHVLGNAKAEWTLRHFLGSASLLAKSCQAALMLANQPYELQQMGHLFGRNLALAWNAQQDLQIFEKIDGEPFSLICAPLLFHLEYDSNFYDEIKKITNIENADFKLFREVILSGPGLEKTKLLKEEFISNASAALERFPESDAKTALKKIVSVL